MLPQACDEQLAAFFCRRFWLGLALQGQGTKQQRPRGADAVADLIPLRLGLPVTLKFGAFNQPCAWQRQGQLNPGVASTQLQPGDGQSLLANEGVLMMQFRSPPLAQLVATGLLGPLQGDPFRKSGCNEAGRDEPFALIVCWRQLPARWIRRAGRQTLELAQELLAQALNRFQAVVGTSTEEGQPCPKIDAMLEGAEGIPFTQKSREVGAQSIAPPCACMQQQQSKAWMGTEPCQLPARWGQASVLADDAELLQLPLALMQGRCRRRIKPLQIISEPGPPGRQIKNQGLWITSLQFRLIVLRSAGLLSR